jgi:hypothetical protein
VPLARLPDESRIPVDVATRLGDGAEKRPSPAIPGLYSRISALSAFIILPSSFDPEWLWWSLGVALGWL